MENSGNVEKQPDEERLVAAEKKTATLSNCTWQLHHEQRQVLDELFNPVFKFARYFGGHLPRKDLNPCRYYCHLLFLLTIAGFALYQLGYIFVYVVSEADYNVTTASTLVVLTWHFQAVLSLFFLIYWQEKGYFVRIFKKVHVPNGSAGCKRTKRSIRILFWTFIAVAMSIFVMLALEMCMVMFDHHYYVIFDVEAYNAYGNYMLIPFGSLIAFYTFIFWIIAMLIYISMTIAVNGELTYFNEELAKLGDNDDPENARDIGSELLLMYHKHCKLSDLVRELDNTFEVYTFAMIGTNIPTTIFSLLAFFVNLRISWWNVLFATPSVVCCILSMVGLTTVPARLHSSISKVEKILYGIKCIWLPYSAKNYQVAHLFISHVNQTNLGISVWGFAVVTKPLILTTISLTITYLSFFLQMRSTCNNSSCVTNATLQ